MKETAMQQLIIIFEGMDLDDELSASFKYGIKLARGEAQELLKKEKEQIEKAFSSGIFEAEHGRFDMESKEYFDENFKTQ
jgi:uncharacterized cupin superfamily protein